VHSFGSGFDVPYPFVAVAIFLAGVLTGILPRAAQLAIFAACGLLCGILLGIPLGTARGPGVLTILLRSAMALAAIAVIAAALWRIFRANEAIELQSEWGTLSQGIGGWRLSPPAALLLLGILLSALAIGLPSLAPTAGNGTAACQPAGTAAPQQKPKA
jgi:hypothetical protein